MPWLQQGNDKVYIPSCYTKDELPAWSEIFIDYIENKGFIYDPRIDAHNNPDPYWKIPRRKCIIAMVCNQINKMIFEDGLQSKIIDFCNANIMPPVSTCDDVRCIIEPVDYNNIEEFMTTHYIGEANVFPNIYTIPLPNGMPNPFIINNFRRININDLDAVVVKWFMHIKEDNSAYIIDPMEHIGLTDKEYASEMMRKYGMLTDFILKDIIDYFTEPIGWKH